MRTSILISILLFGVVASLPFEKPTKKFPKKYDEVIHSTDFKNTDKNTDSSYSSFNKAGELDEMKPPQVIPSFSQKAKSSFPSSDVIVKEPKDFMEPPSEDSYSSFPEGTSMEVMKPPPVSAPEEQPSTYQEYVYPSEGELLPLEAPEPSSYLAIPPTYSEDILRKFASMASAAESLPPTELRPPSSDEYESSPSESSYIVYENPSRSSYSLYEEEPVPSTFFLQPPAEIV